VKELRLIREVGLDPLLLETLVRVVAVKHVAELQSCPAALAFCQRLMSLMLLLVPLLWSAATLVRTTPQAMHV
jgi:hypothetical protein